MNWASMVTHPLTKNIAFKILEILFRVNLYKLRNVYLKTAKNDKLISFTYQTLQIYVMVSEVCLSFEEEPK